MFKQSSLKYFNELVRNESFTKDELIQFNFLKRKKLFEFAYENIPFYREKYSLHGIHSNDIQNEKDWLKIPILSKNELKKNFDQIENKKLALKNKRISTTGGTTGKPVSVIFDRRVPFEAMQWRTLKWWGVEPWENQAYVYRSVRTGFRESLNKLMWWPTKRILLDVSYLDRQKIDQFYTDIIKLDPKILQGYVGGLAEIASNFRNRENLLDLKAVWATSAPLTELHRKLMEESFGAPVYDQYGCGEIFWLAAECKMQNGLHFFSDIRHIEFLDGSNIPVNDNEIGNVILTDLENYAFPLIRYQNGDEGRFLSHDCSCGCHLPLIDKIRGRVSDFLTTPSGVYVNGSYLTTLFDNFPDAVESFQIVQNKDYSIDVNIVSNHPDNFHIFYKKVKETLLSKTNHEIEVRVNIVDKIDTDRGKLQFIINKLLEK